MAKINTRDFVGTRAKFQRMADAKLFNGWIESFFGSKLEVSTPSDTIVEVGDVFRFEGFGHHISVVFNAKLENVATYEQPPAVEGVSNRFLEARRTTLSLVVNSPVRYAASPESVRVHAENLPTRLHFADQVLDGICVDAAPNGAGVIVADPIDPGTNLICTIQTAHGAVRAQGTALYCKLDRERPEAYRIGIKFTDMGRIERPRWDRYINEPAA